MQNMLKQSSSQLRTMKCPQTIYGCAKGAVSLILEVLIFAGVVMRKSFSIIFLVSVSVLSFPKPIYAQDCVVLLHGFLRVSNSMSELEEKLIREGFSVANINYQSRKHQIDFLSYEAVSRGINMCIEKNPVRIHFITHSLGGILVRHFFGEHTLLNLGRVVMLGPPNQGSELVDRLKFIPGFSLLGPAGKALGTGADSIPKKLGPVSFELGVIAGTRNMTPLGFFLLDRPNDSVVTVESTKVNGMNEHISLPVTHTLMMRNDDVIDHSINFLRTGQF